MRKRYGLTLLISAVFFSSSVCTAADSQTESAATSGQVATVEHFQTISNQSAVRSWVNTIKPAAGNQESAYPLYLRKEYREQRVGRSRRKLLNE